MRIGVGTSEHSNDPWGSIQYWEFLYISEDLAVLMKLGLFRGVLNTSLSWNILPNYQL